MKKIQKHTYRFNPHTLRYEKVLVTLRDRVKRISFSVLFGVVLGVVVVVVTLQFMEAPRERALRREVAQYKRQLRVLGDRVERAEAVLTDLEERDDVLYRTIFESEPVSEATRRSGIGGVERYAEFDKMENGALLKQTTMMVDDLTKRLYVESKSMDELYSMARTKNERMASMPAIMPARPGTPIYATGDGVVRVAGRNPQGMAGYGVVTLIDHGFGIQTLYAHMQNTKVRVGQKVKRGEQIGTVGSSGMSSGSHLHYEVIINGKKVDPVYYFGGDLTPQEYEDVLELARQENQSMS